MTRYIIKRILMTMLIVFVVMFIVFVLLYWVSGYMMRVLPIEGDGDALDAMFAFFNASNNVFTRYLRYIFNVVFHFDFGTAWGGWPLVYSLMERTRNTVIMLGTGTILTLIAGIPIGIIAAVKKDRLGDRIVNVLTTLLSSIPIFAIAFVILVFFVLHLRILPANFPYVTPSVFIMPAITIALNGIATVARMTRASMIEVLEQPYILALRARGLKESQVLCRHALKNALIPVISAFGGFVSQLFLGIFVVESFFTIHGLSSLILQSVELILRELGLIRFIHEMLGAVLIMTVILAVVNLASDIAYTIVNPKIRLRYSSKSRIKRGAK